MGRVMVFIDFENFNISMRSYFKTLNQPVARLDYSKLSQSILKMLPGDNQLLKTYLFAPKPDEFLMKEEWRKNMYNWINGLKNLRYLTVIEGQHIARPAEGYTTETMDINNRASYYVVEKGTDINIGVNLVTKGFMNAYDTAIVVSGDTDYIPALDILNSIGKVTVVAGVQGQNLSRIRPHADDTLILDKDFFDTCRRD